jgi:hypothetical protein
VTHHAQDGSGFETQQGQQVFSHPHSSALALGPTQPPAQWVTGISPSSKTTHPHLAPRLRTRTAMSLLPLFVCMACYGETFTSTRCLCCVLYRRSPHERRRYRWMNNVKIDPTLNRMGMWPGFMAQGRTNGRPL